MSAFAGNDANSGNSPSAPKKTIQAALSQVSPNGQVRVFPGAYLESAPGSIPSTLAGTYQFGLFFAASKPGVTLMGVSASDRPIEDAGDIQVTITTDATNNFGPDGIFIDADNTTIQGVRIGPNVSGDNKTIEVVANNFTLQYCETAVPGGGSVYIDDFTPGGTRVKGYHIVRNHFPDATSIDIASGAGLTGALKDRQITDNDFDLGGYSWNAISFNGSGTTVPWFVYSVGGAVIRNNTFKGGAEQYIRARGTYDNTQFDWKAFWNENDFANAAVVLARKQSFDVRAYSYATASYSFPNTRRIGLSAAIEAGHQLPGDIILTKRHGRSDDQD